MQFKVHFHEPGPWSGFQYCGCRFLEKLWETDKKWLLIENHENLGCKCHSFLRSVGAKLVHLKICGCSCTHCIYTNYSPVNPCVCKRFFFKTSSWLSWTPLMEIWRRKNSGDVSILQTRLVVLQVLYVSSCIHYSLLHLKTEF